MANIIHDLINTFSSVGKIVVVVVFDATQLTFYDAYDDKFLYKETGERGKIAL